MSDLFQNHAAKSGPVDCLGKTFPSHEARREYYMQLLNEKLKDPEFKKIEGFPVGTDESILAMSDPPYYTACPNPFLEEFVRHNSKPYNPSEKYSREPLTIDVSVGKTDPLYKAHAYHTKVPHLAIVPSILHYTEPGDLVLDGFSGSGMTGIAAQWCGIAPAAYRLELETEWRKASKQAPKWGSRRIVLNDLSPAATFMTANYNQQLNVDSFEQAGTQLLKEVEQEIGWMYETQHDTGETKGRIEYTVWSEVFSCPDCVGEVNFLNEALDVETKKVKAIFTCPHCGVELTKKKLERLYVGRFDPVTKQTLDTPKRVPVLICYKVAGKRFEKKPDELDLQLISKIEQLSLPPKMPTVPFPFEDMWEAPRLKDKGIDATHHLFLPRAAQAMESLWQKALKHPDCRIRSFLLFFVDQGIRTLSLLNSFEPLAFSQNARGPKGTYYVPSQISEISPWYFFNGKLARLVKAFRNFHGRNVLVCVSTGSTTSLPVPTESVDYIFTDPPFGDNFPYAELNFVTENWYGVVTDMKPESVVDRSKKNRSSQKSVDDYRRLMSLCFTDYYRVLKPGRWMTVVFSNTKASVWNSLQTALQEAGFVVANVSALDKKQGSFKAVTTTVAVKQDLVISAYKPNGGLEQRFVDRGPTAESVWDFVETHLKQLPVIKLKDGELEFIPERDPRILFDRLVSWFVRHSASVPLSSQEFQGGLSHRFASRDGMVFLPEQVTEYEKKRMQVVAAPQMEMFVFDERSAIDWLTDFLKGRPSTYQEIHADFISQLGAGWKKRELKPELSGLLEDNFIQYDGSGDVPSQIHSYLSTNHKDLRGLGKSDPDLVTKAKDRWYVPDPNKAQDLEKKREKALLKEFEVYKSFTGRKIKESRLEVLRAGFNASWANKDYQTIIDIANKLPDETLQVDEKLLTLYDMALTRSEAGD